MYGPGRNSGFSVDTNPFEGTDGNPTTEVEVGPTVEVVVVVVVWKLVTAPPVPTD